jgi:hypothetical protein
VSRTQARPKASAPTWPAGQAAAGFTARLIEDLAAGVAAGQHRPAPTATTTRRRSITAPRLLPRTIQVCIHCRQEPAGFWVSRDTGQKVRRSWCLSCCQDLDPGCYHVQPFDS